MKTSKEEILQISLKLFAERGFESVSTSMIASELGITKGALYRHFKNKQAIFDQIIARMFELDTQQADEHHVPAGEYEEDQEAYQNAGLTDLCEFVNDQFIFWTENEFVRNFRRMITIEQYKNEEMNQLYQDVIGLGPVRYTENLFKEMLRNGQLNEEAARMGAWNLAIQLFAPLQLSIQFIDGGADREETRENLRQITLDFQQKYMRSKVR